MTIEISNVQRLRVDTEAAGSFTTDGTGTLANFKDVPFIEGSLNAAITREVLDPQHAQQHLDGYSTQVLGVESCTLSFSMLLAPTGTAAGNATAAVQSALGEILKAVMGGEDLDTGSTVNDAGAAATDFDVASVSNFSAGNAVGFVTDAGAFEARRIYQITGSNLALILNYSEAPDNSDVIYASATYYLTQNPDTSLQFILEGFELQDRWLLRGLQLESMAIDIPLGQLPKVTFNFKGAAYTYGASAASNLTSSALSQASYTNISVIHATGSFFYQTYNTTTLPTALPISAATFEPKITYIPVTSPSASATGEHVIYRWRRNRVAPVFQGTFTLPYEDTTYYTDRDNKTLKQLWYQLGNAAGSCVCLDVPTAQVTDVQPADAGGIASQTVSWRAQLDQGTTGSTDASDSAFRIHFL